MIKLTLGESPRPREANPPQLDDIGMLQTSQKFRLERQIASALGILHPAILIQQLRPQMFHGIARLFGIVIPLPALHVFASINFLLGERGFHRTLGPEAFNFVHVTEFPTPLQRTQDYLRGLEGSDDVPRVEIRLKRRGQIFVKVRFDPLGHRRGKIVRRVGFARRGLTRGYRRD